MNKFYLIVLLFVLTVAGAFFWTYQQFIVPMESEPVVERPVPTEAGVIKERKDLNARIGDSLLRDEPERLQGYFSEKVAQHTNDSFSRAAIYFITHRYFDNGGDIYEIVDYVAADENLAFLNEAREVYPEIFAKIEAREKLSKDERLLAYLAYMEALQKSGYADAAAYGTAAAKYIELYDLEVASSKTAIAKSQAESYKTKAVSFAESARPLVEQFRDVLGQSGEDISKDDMLVGLSQYAVTLAFFKKHHVSFDTKYSYDSLFDFALQYATRHGLVLKPFTALNYNYALITAGDDTTETVARAGLGQIMTDTYKKVEYKKNGLVDRMVNGEAKGYNHTGIYGKATINKIIAHDPTFKAFMEARGYRAK